MHSAEVQLIGMHGITWSLGPETRVGLTAGTWNRGRIVVTDADQPPLVLGWERTELAPNPAPTSRRLAARLGRDVGAGSMTVGELDGGALVTLNGSRGPGHGAWRHVPAAGVVLTVRQTGSGPEGPVRRTLMAATAVQATELAPWRIHGLQVVLPTWWRLEAVECVPGLSRGVWLRRKPGSIRTEAALVLRRWALAGRLLAEQSVGEWLRTSLDPGEVVTSESDAASVVRFTTRRAGPDWWSRFRGRRRERTLWAWREDTDRLVVQEWAGTGDPVPPWPRLANGLATDPGLPRGMSPGGSRPRG